MRLVVKAVFPSVSQDLVCWAPGFGAVWFPGWWALRLGGERVQAGQDQERGRC